MQIKFWGTRGSIAKAGPETVRYGGNTSCVEVRSAAGELVVIDCGTGCHGLGQALVAEAKDYGIKGHILISHTHWDHIQGIPFFAPLFLQGNEWHIYGPRGLGNSLEETLAGQMQYTYFPITLEQLGADIHYHDLVEGEFKIGDIAVTTHYLNHPALTLGYRLTADGVTVVYASDHEQPGPNAALDDWSDRDSEDSQHVAFLADADLVIHDTQYLADEYPAKVGWGHSTVEYAIDAARKGNVRRLALYHHEPTRNDAGMDALLDHAHAYAEVQGYTGEVFAATEGLEIQLEGSATGTQLPLIKSASATQTPVRAVLSHYVLVAVANAEIAADIRAAVDAEDFMLLEASDPSAILELARSKQPAIILLESELPGGDALELYRSLREVRSSHGIETTIVGVTDNTHTAQHTRMVAAGITEWLVWPCGHGYLRTKIRAWVLRMSCRWEQAPLPKDEPERLRSLRATGILDTESEPRFDRYTERASKLFDVPIALVSLVDSNRQWFKSKQGLDVTETPRDMAFCAHAILSEKVFQIPDTLEDARFADNPLVTNAPRIRFYAGVSLTLSNGSRVGTLCVIDHRPRILDASQIKQLRKLGKLVEKELESKNK